MPAKKRSKSENSVGRPTIMTKSVIDKLEEVYAIGGTDEEACFYADIAMATLYKYQLRNPAFVERKEALKNKPILLARQTVVKALQHNVSNAQWFLARKRKAEFSERTELTGADGQALNPDEKSKIDAIFNENSGKK